MLMSKQRKSLILKDCVAKNVCELRQSVSNHAHEDDNANDTHNHLQNYIIDIMRQTECNKNNDLAFTKAKTITYATPPYVFFRKVTDPPYPPKLVAPSITHNRLVRVSNPHCECS